MYISSVDAPNHMLTSYIATYVHAEYCNKTSTILLLLLLLLLLLQACGLHNQVVNDLGILTERQI